MTVKILNDSIQLPDVEHVSSLPASGEYKLWIHNKTVHFGNLTEIISLRKLFGYDGIVVVDAGGNGDFETLSAAITSGVVQNGTVIYIFGDVTDSYPIDFSDIKSVTVYITPGAVLRPEQLYAVGCTHTIIGPGLLAPQGGNVQGLIPYLYDANMTLTLRDLHINNVGGRGLDLTSVQNTIQVLAYNTVFQGTHSIYAGINKIASTSKFDGCTLVGTLLAPAPAPWTNAPFYHCVFNGTVTNVTAAAGTANGSNIVIA